jgi:Lamin Tail Domain
MRHIAIRSLVLGVVGAVAACVPAVPSVDSLTSTAGAGEAAGSGGAGADDAAPTFPATRDAAPRSLPDDAAGAASDAGRLDTSRDAESEALAPRAQGAAGGDGGDSDVGAGQVGADASERDGAVGLEASGGDATAARAPRAGEVLIDELLVDPAGDDLGHEWIEIANAAGVPLDLASLHVSDGTTDAAVDAGVLGPGALLVLGQTVDRAHNGDAPVDLAYGTRLALNNGGDRVAICVGPCTSGLTLDAVAWSTPWGPDYVGHAVVLDLATGATCPAESPYGADGNYGSPGQPNPPCPGAAPAPPEMTKLPPPG